MNPLPPLAAEMLARKDAPRMSVRLTLHYNALADEKTEAMTGCHRHAAIQSEITLPPRVDEVDTARLGDLRKAWLASIDRRTAPFDCEPDAESPDERAQQIWKRVVRQQAQKERTDAEREHASTAQLPIPSRFTVNLPEDAWMRKMVIKSFVPFKGVRAFLLNLEREVETRKFETYPIRSVDLECWKAPEKSLGEQLLPPKLILPAGINWRQPPAPH